jgi:hypothetical protein
MPVPIKHAARLARHRRPGSSPSLRVSSRKARLPLDDFLPHYDVNEVHSTRVAASPADALAAARAVTGEEVPLAGALMALRRLPAALRGRADEAHRMLDVPILDQMTGSGFVLLEERPDEVVLGVVGRFWTLDGGIRRISAAEFAGFDEPGCAKAVMNFHIREIAGGSLLTTETRIAGTDEDARRKFRRYWRIVMPGSALIRRAWLRAIRKRAERR